MSKGVKGPLVLSATPGDTEEGIVSVPVLGEWNGRVFYCGEFRITMNEIQLLEEQWGNSVRKKMNKLVLRLRRTFRKRII